MPSLVALDLPGGPEFVDALWRVWDRGDAALPVDGRLSPPDAMSTITMLGAGTVIDAHGEHKLDGGIPTEPGDAVVVATSGTTGTDPSQPKGVVLTHDAIAASALATHRRLGVTASDHWLACLPLSHVGGLSVVTRAVLNGVALTVLPRFDPDAVHRAAVAGATSTSLVGTALGRIDPSIFHRIVLGGGRPPADRPPNTVTTYGLTETGSGVVYDGVPLDGVEIEIAADGEILIRCPMQLRAYRDGSSPVDGDGWLHTNDAGRWLDDGRLHVDGRRGDLIITGGENVWPETVERVLAGVPAVADVAIIGTDDPEWGQIVTACVVVAPEFALPTLDELRTCAKESLPAFMAPRAVIRVASIPRTTLGKVLRNVLSNQLAEHR